MSDMISLCEVSIVKGGSGFPEKYQGIRSGTYPFIKVSDMNLPENRIFITDASNYVDEKLVTMLGLRIFPKGTIVFAKVGAAIYLNKRRILTKNTIIDNNMMGIIPNGFDQFFLYQFLLGVDLAEFTQPGALPSVNQNIICRISVPNFSLPYQGKVHSILGAIDQVIESTQALIEKYQLIKSGLMHDLFTRGIGADGKLRPPREAAPELYQETAIGWIPKEWRLAKLSSLSKAGTPHLKTGPFGSSLKGEHWVDEGIPVITIGALGEGEFINEELLFITEKYANFLREYRMRSGEIVFSRVADVGRSVVIGVEETGWVMSSNLMRIHLDEKLMNSVFLQSQLSFDSRLKKQIRCKVNTGGREVANSEVLNSLLFVFPPLSEQQLIIGRAEINNQKIRTEKFLLEKLRKQKAGLMHDLLTGKVQVKVEDTEENHA